MNKYYMQINLIDSILKEFFTQYELKNLLTHIEEFGHGTNFHYKFNDNIYNGRFYNYKTLNQDCIINQLVICLSHDGFCYSTLSDVDVSEIHGVIPTECILQLTTLRNIQKEVKAEKVMVSYNQKCDTLDIEFFSDNDGKTCCLKIYFEKGSPHRVNKKNTYATYAFKNWLANF